MQHAALMLIAASYSIDSAHSSAGFAVKHLMVSTARGQFDRVTGRVEIDDADLTRSRIDVTIEAASVNTRNAKRDEHLRSTDFFDEATYPLITFKSSYFEIANGKLLASGNLTIQRVTRPVTPAIDSIAPPPRRRGAPGCAGRQRPASYRARTSACAGTRDWRTAAASSSTRCS